ncbi:MAG: CDP-diacylglycerol--glycerol-3-phosphate 3-phosphatidyltransferase [Alphaproteobacteria bacterium CG_4_10_14_0_8_um_filter_37_21]|nr:MAG: CDP-diacylglycerol--glycerol-3-phosphate 3-phosphatidyltransferase [Alphaproteobacteria bacterium CG_4_10_14_0_8_um_filter_37_21]
MNTSKKTDNPKLNVPNVLTMGRIVLIFTLVPCFYYQSDTARLMAFIIFCVACITDYLDGFFARVLNQTTKFGMLFDPVADKILISTTLFLMAAFNYFTAISIIPGMIILCREMLVSGLREFMGSKEKRLAVSRLAKYKTTFQMLAIGLILMADAFSYASELKNLGEAFLWIAAILTLITGAQYFRTTMKYI